MRKALKEVRGPALQISRGASQAEGVQWPEGARNGRRLGLEETPKGRRLREEVRDDKGAGL